MFQFVQKQPVTEQVQFQFLKKPLVINYLCFQFVQKTLRNEQIVFQFVQKQPGIEQIQFPFVKKLIQKANNFFYFFCRTHETITREGLKLSIIDFFEEVSADKPFEVPDDATLSEVFQLRSFTDYCWAKHRCTQVG